MRAELAESMIVSANGDAEHEAAPAAIMPREMFEIQAAALAREVEIRQHTRRVAIVAKAPASKMLAPYGDPDWHIWSLGDSWRFIPAMVGRCRWFEIHDLDDGFERWPHDFADWLKADHGIPLYVQANYSQVPHGILFPWRDMIRDFKQAGFSGARYFNNSVSWMIAFAVWEKMRGLTPLEEIGLFGVDMAQHGLEVKSSGEMGSSEYAHQRPSCEYWIGIAEGLGIKVTVPKQSDLLTVDRLYAIDSHGTMGPKVETKKKEISHRLHETSMQIERLQAEKLQYIGALTALNWRDQGASVEQLKVAKNGSAEPQPAG